MVLNVEEIKGILPHRAPFLLVDRIIEMEPYKYAKGIKNVTYNEPQFHGHFPDVAIMPGVLILEAMAQVGGVCMLYPEENRGMLALFAAMDNVKFKHKVVPGDQLIMEATVTKIKGNFGKVHTEATVDGQLVARADFTYALQRPEEQGQ